MKEKSNYWDTQFTDLSQFLMAIQKLAEKKQQFYKIQSTRFREEAGTFLFCQHFAAR